jgi:DNA invertase Pin-like site-specific DNA recombinase
MARKKAQTTTQTKPLDNRVCVFCRVSTDSQHNGRQLADLKTFAESRKWTVTAEITETISGVVDNQERAGVVELLDKATAGEFSRVLVTELSRLGRNALQVQTLIEQLKRLGVSVVVQTLGIETLNDNGTDNPVAGLLCGILSQISSIERTWIKERQASGIARAKAQGKHLGRPKDSRESAADFLKKHSAAVKLLRKDTSIRNVAKLTNIAPATAQKIRRILNSQQNGEQDNQA